MAGKPDPSRARKAFRAFTGHEPVSGYRTSLDDRDVSAYRLGKLVGVAYEAKRDGVTDRYFHEFAAKARPDLNVRDDGRQLYISQGKYHVTDRGIEDLPGLFVINPSPRSKAKGPSPMRRRRKTRRAPTRQVAVFRANPVRKRRRRRAVSRSSPIVYRRNPARRKRGYRRNPSSRGMFGAGMFSKFFIPAIGVGIGAVGVEAAMGAIPFPAQMTTGVMRHVTKGALAVAGGLAISKVFRQKRLGEFFMLGGLMIAVHDALKEVIVRQLPSAKFGEYLPGGMVRGALGYVGPGSLVPGMGAYVPNFTGSLGGNDFSQSQPDFGI